MNAIKENSKLFQKGTFIKFMIPNFCSILRFEMLYGYLQHTTKNQLQSKTEIIDKKGSAYIVDKLDKMF